MMPRATEPSAMTLAHEVGLAFGQTSSCGISYRGAALTPNVSRVLDGECWATLNEELRQGAV